MMAHPARPPYAQLALPLSTPDPADRLAASAEALIALNGAVRFLLAVAEGHTAPGPATACQLQESLDVLAAFNLGGRLGHVVRRFRTRPPTPASWAELGDELAFVIRLYEGEPTP